jgi:hypothetical protein
MGHSSLTPNRSLYGENDSDWDGLGLCDSDVGIYDRVVIQDILKEIAQTQQVDLNAKQKFKGEQHVSTKAGP